MPEVKKKILIAIDTSENSNRALKYTGEMVGSSIGFNVTLLHVIRCENRDNYTSDEDWEKACYTKGEKGLELLKNGRDILQRYGIKEDSMEDLIVTSKTSSVAAEIMKVQKEGEYDTVVVGRRGISKAEEFLFGSVSNKVVHYSSNCTVWVIA